MKTILCAQGSPDWFEARCGSVTSSRVAAALAFLTRKSKNGGPGDETAARATLKKQLVAERLTGIHTEHYVSKAMEWGTENEPLARTAYEMRTGETVDLLGYALHPSIAYAGASPDGLVGKDGMIECKCPNTTTHLDYLISRKVPEEYEPQMMWQMACTGRKWNDFISFDPRMPEKYQLLVCRLPRDDKRIAEMEDGVIKLLTEVEELIKQLDAGEDYLEQKLAASVAMVEGITQSDIDAVWK